MIKNPNILFVFQGALSLYLGHQDKQPELYVDQGIHWAFKRFFKTSYLLKILIPYVSWQKGTFECLNW